LPRTRGGETNASPEATTPVEVEQLQALLAESKGRPCSEAHLGIERGQGDGGELVDQLVYADLAPLGQLSKSLMLIV